MKTRWLSLFDSTYTDSPQEIEAAVVSACFAERSFNLRASNTEPLLRLNVENRGSPGLMEQRRHEILALIGLHGQDMPGSE